MDKKSTFEKLLISKTFHRIFLSLVLNYPLRKIFLIYGNISLFVYAGSGVLAGGLLFITNANFPNGQSCKILIIILEINITKYRLMFLVHLN